MKSTKKTLAKSIIALILCISVFVGTTFAWFTDNVFSGRNVINSGNIDLEMYWANDPAGPWYNVEEDAYNTIFKYDNWEPGYTEVKYIKLRNAGSLAAKYKLAITPETAVGKLAEVIQVYYATDAVKINDRTELQNLGSLGSLKNVLTKDDVIKGTLLAEDQQSPYHPTEEVVLTLAMSMITTAGNDYQSKSAGKFSITAVATQAPFEEDSFGPNYDSLAELPIVLSGDSVSSAVTNNGGIVAEDVNIQGNGVSATVPAGVALDQDADRVTLIVTPLQSTTSDLVAVNNEVLIPVDVHVEGVAEDNNVPIIVNLGAILPKNLNVGNYTFFHVEDGENKVMTLVNSAAELTAHNAFTYDPLTGEVSVAMASFSEVVALADNDNLWKGTVAEGFSKGNGSEDDPYIIANADQLAYMGYCVSNDNAKYGGAHYKLVADIDLGSGQYDEKAGKAHYFYPIGYNKVGGEVATISDDLDEIYFQPINPAVPGSKDGDVAMTMADNSWYTYGGSFKGTFDGNGHTISGIYQNTWAMKGNYDGHYYNAAMGLFGYVNGGTVKNLNIDNFNSEGEFAPTGCITAYAGGETTFENISITHSHPQTYNTGVAGIVGWDNGNSKFSFKNITVDATNTVSALWGSWDVAASGILGSLKNESGANFENCHVAATIDVYNDVCGNYQYYWYRYSGAFIGTVYARQDGGTGALDLDKVNAIGCTANFGTIENPRHEYYYCEFTENTKASYTHDYQMSRIDPDDVLGQGDGAKCQNHDHESAGYETINGQKVLVEDKQAVYIPYRQLFGGYGWGVDGVDLGEYENIGIGTIDNSVEKFEPEIKNNEEYEQNTTVKIGDIFKIKDNSVDLVVKDGLHNVQVTVSPVIEEESTVVGEYAPNYDNWEEGTITFTGKGAAQIIITDYYFCKTASVIVNITEPKVEEKFVTKFTNKYTYRVGNKNAVSLGSLFGEKSDVKKGIKNTVLVEVTTTSGTASGTYTANASNWANGTLQFSGTGVVEVTITEEDNYCTPFTITLEVVDAVNATSATNATTDNVVLLNDAGFSSLEVSGGYTLYGNGFTLTCDSDSPALDTGYSFVTLNNGILDNVQIVCPNFDYAVLYKSNMTESGNRSQTTDKTRYYNVKSGVTASGNSQILNSRISGARAAVNVTGGNLLIDNSRIERGAVASLLVGSANSLTLRDVTLVQKPTASTYDPNKTLMGFSVLFICDADGNTAPVTIEGNLVQNAWVNESDKQYVPSAGQSIISTVLGKTDYLHDIDGDGTKESLNLGFAYMPESVTSKVNTTTITDNRTNKDNVPYAYAEVPILNGKTYVYSYKNSKGTADDFKTESEYKPNKQSDIITVSYADKADGLETSKTFGTNGWVYELNVDLDKNPGYRFSFDNLSMTVNGAVITDYKVNGAAKPTSPVAVAAGGVTYTLTATVEGKTHTATYKVIGTETSKESPSKISGPTTAGFGVAKSYGGDWSGAADVLTGVKVKYWSVAENKYVEFDFANFTVPGNAGKLNGTNSYWEYTHTNNDFTLKVTNTVAIHSGKSVYGMPIRGTDGKLYFTISSTNGYVGTGTTSRAVTMQYEFTDNNGGEKLTFTHTFNISYNKDDQYSYSDLSGSGKLTQLKGSSGGGCVTPDTLITLADGSKVRVDSLTGDEELLVWNHETGKLEKAPVAYIVNHDGVISEREIIHLNFANGKTVKMIGEHVFFDATLNKYVAITSENANDFIGHTFVALAADGTNVEKVVLESLEREIAETGVYEVVSYKHLTCFTEGVLSASAYLDPLLNVFDVSSESLAYDMESVMKDVEEYGLYTYDDFDGLISEEAFELYNAKYLKIAVGKGYIDWNDILGLIDIYFNVDVNPIQ